MSASSSTSMQQQAQPTLTLNPTPPPTDPPASSQQSPRPPNYSALGIQLMNSSRRINGNAKDNPYSTNNTETEFDDVVDAVVDESSAQINDENGSSAEPASIKASLQSLETASIINDENQVAIAAPLAIEDSTIEALGIDSTTVPEITTSSSPSDIEEENAFKSASIENPSQIEDTETLGSQALTPPQNQQGIDFSQYIGAIRALNTEVIEIDRDDVGSGDDSRLLDYDYDDDDDDDDVDDDDVKVEDEADDERFNMTSYSKAKEIEIGNELQSFYEAEEEKEEMLTIKPHLLVTEQSLYSGTANDNDDNDDNNIYSYQTQQEEANTNIKYNTNTKTNTNKQHKSALLMQRTCVSYIQCSLSRIKCLSVGLECFVTPLLLTEVKQIEEEEKKERDRLALLRLKEEKEALGLMKRETGGRLNGFAVKNYRKPYPPLKLKKPIEPKTADSTRTVEVTSNPTRSRFLINGPRNWNHSDVVIHHSSHKSAGDDESSNMLQSINHYSPQKPTSNKNQKPKTTAVQMNSEGLASWFTPSKNDAGTRCLELHSRIDLLSPQGRERMTKLASIIDVKQSLVLKGLLHEARIRYVNQKYGDDVVSHVGRHERNTTPREKEDEKEKKSVVEVSLMYLYSKSEYCGYIALSGLARKILKEALDEAKYSEGWSTKEDAFRISSSVSPSSGNRSTSGKIATSTSTAESEANEYHESLILSASPAVNTGFEEVRG